MVCTRGLDASGVESSCSLLISGEPVIVSLSNSQGCARCSEASAVAADGESAARMLVRALGNSRAQWQVGRGPRLKIQPTSTCRVVGERRHTARGSTLTSRCLETAKVPASRSTCHLPTLARQLRVAWAPPAAATWRGGRWPRNGRGLGPDSEPRTQAGLRPAELLAAHARAWRTVTASCTKDQGAHGMVQRGGPHRLGSRRHGAAVQHADRDRTHHPRIYGRDLDYAACVHHSTWDI